MSQNKTHNFQFSYLLQNQTNADVLVNQNFSIIDSLLCNIKFAGFITDVPENKPSSDLAFINSVTGNILVFQSVMNGYIEIMPQNGIIAFNTVDSLCYIYSLEKGMWIKYMTETTTVSIDNIVETEERQFISLKEKEKLAGIQNGITVNDSNENLTNRSNHTGTQTAETISDFQTQVSANLDVLENVNARHTHYNRSSLDLVLGINTGDETTSSIQAKRPLKTISGQSLEGSGDVSLSKSQVDLGNVDNTSDANKPISTATQIALDLKADKTGIITSLLTGFSAASSALSILATDSILGAFQKVQYYIANLLTNFNGSNQLVKLNSNGQYPAVDGSLITNITGQFSVGDLIQSLALSKAGFLICNGGSYSMSTYATLWALMNRQVATSFTVVNNTITINSHGLLNGQQIYLSISVGGLVAYTNYFVCNASTNTFQLCSSYPADPVNGTIIPLTITTGSYTSTITWSLAGVLNSTDFYIPNLSGYTLAMASATFATGVMVGSNSHTLSSLEVGKNEWAFYSDDGDSQTGAARSVQRITIDGVQKVISGTGTTTVSPINQTAHNNMQPTAFLGNIFIKF